MNRATTIDSYSPSTFEVDTSHPLYLVNAVMREVDKAWYRTSPNPFCASFSFVGLNGRRFAAAEYGSGFYDEGWLRYLIIDLCTGAFLRASGSRCILIENQLQSEDKCQLQAFNDPGAIPDDDPIRAWLSGKNSPLRIDTEEQLKRYSAVEILRSDRPNVCPRVEVAPGGFMWRRPDLGLLIENYDPDELPYFILFGKHIVPLTALGSGIGRRRASEKSSGWGT